LSLSPAINASYKSAGQKVCKKINEVMNSYPQTRHIIIEDIPLSIFLSKIKHKYTNFKIAIRSHNELEKAFEFFCKNGPLWWRAAWKLECLKIKMLEKKAGKESNIFWTISQNDLEAYIKRLNVYPKGVIGVYISNNFYKHIPSGSRNTVIYLGSADLRKGMGLKRFISKVWPVVRKARPDARLILAGFGTEVFSDPLLGVQGLGKIENDREVLEQGRIFINPQYIGSGIQLKSIVAMLSSKALVSTRTGVEGVNGENGKHFIIAELSEDMALEILSLMDNPDRANKIGQAAQKFASDMYNKGRLMKEAYQLLEEYVG
jgi:glycosyltransferase involved in cell wall biosynthesis